MATKKETIDNELEPVATPFKVVVAAERLNIRSRMSTESEVVTVVCQNDVLDVEKAKSAQWLKVNAPVSGFVKAEFVTVV